MRDLTIERVPWELTSSGGLELWRRHRQRRNLAGPRKSTSCRKPRPPTEAGLYGHQPYPPPHAGHTAGNG